ncbi:MAG: hypothetical protein HGA45_34650, partial [Chloroflexales bacterium]|nr:hypothetical protein [Chloroflexales bacterium]
AAQKHAPGLVRSAPAQPGRAYGGAPRARQSSGRWVRRGNKIIIFGV